MASGGARARSGPPPDPNALRRDRKDDAAGWLTLTPRTAPAPEFPLPEETDREAVLWEREWRRPQASEWERLGLENEVALYVRAFAEAEKPDAPATIRNFVRMAQENLGLSIPGLARHRWIVPSSASASTTSTRTTPKKPRRSSSRDRFTVVPSPPPEDDPAPF